VLYRGDDVLYSVLRLCHEWRFDWVYVPEPGIKVLLKSAFSETIET
jgi:hypothetical protein